jgi:replicative DNA helicase
MSTDTLQVPPQAIDAEMAVLGSMMIEPDAVEKAIETLSPDQFYKEVHGKIFQAMLNLYSAGQAVDAVTVGEELSRLKWLAEVGGKAALQELIHQVATAAHVEHYARIVREKAILRELIRVSTEVVGQCFSEKKDAAELLEEAQQRIFTVAQKGATSGFSDPKRLVHETIEQIEKLAQKKTKVTGVSSGLDAFDQKTGGFKKGDLILIAARPSQGKTALALNIAAHVVLHQDPVMPVAVFSLEMERRAIMARFIASEAMADLHQVMNGYFPRHRWADITTAGARFHEAPLYVDDTPGMSVLEVRTRARRLAADLRTQGKELGMIIIDYLQLMRGSSRRQYEGRQQEVAEIARGLKCLARDLNVPVVALSQLNRRVEDKGRSDNKPQLSDLRESGALEQDADLVAFIYREGYYKQNDPTLDRKAEILIAKQRNGPTGSVEVTFMREFTRFMNKEAVAEPAEGEEMEAQVSF